MDLKTGSSDVDAVLERARRGISFATCPVVRSPVYGHRENIVVDRARRRTLRLAVFTVCRAHPARDDGQSHAPCAGAPRRTSGACAATHGHLMANTPALTPRARPRAKAQQPQASRPPPYLANAVAAALPCRRRAGPAAPNQRQPALSYSSSSPSAPPQHRRIVARPPDGAVTVQAPPRRTPEAGHAAGHRRRRSQPFQGQNPPLSMSVAVRDNSSGQVRPSLAGDSAAGEEQARLGTTLQEARNFQGSFWKPRVFV
jgi:hypothetical protein